MTIITPEAVSGIHLDAVGGIAGDMFVAAMLDAMPSLKDRVFSDIAAVLPVAAGSAALTPGMSGGLRALRFGLRSERQGHVHHHHNHEDGHSHSHTHSHEDDHQHAAGGAHHHHGDGAPARFLDLVGLIQSAALREGAAEHAVAILTIIARAEAFIHNVNIDEVYFHELADWDSLLDVVAAGSIAAALPGVVWSASPLPLGGGVVKTQHGLLAVPAPATAAILAGFTWHDDGVGGERVTPTGAAIVKYLIDRPGSRVSGVLLGTGTGAGTRHMAEMPNILRASLFSPGVSAASDAVTLISFEIDDMTGEEIGVAADRLRQVEGVLDLSIGNRLGKKNRPMHDFRLVVRPESATAVSEACLSETSTIGLRVHNEARQVLPRASHAHASGLRAKSVTRPDGMVTHKIESDDLAGIATLAARRRAGAAGQD